MSSSGRKDELQAGVISADVFGFGLFLALGLSGGWSTAWTKLTRNISGGLGVSIWRTITKTGRTLDFEKYTWAIERRPTQSAKSNGGGSIYLQCFHPHL